MNLEEDRMYRVMKGRREKEELREIFPECSSVVKRMQWGEDEEPPIVKKARWVSKEKSSIALHCGSLDVNQKSNDIGRLSGEIPHSLFVPTPSDGQETNSLCPATDPFNIVDSNNTKNHLEIGITTDPRSWDSIPVPPLERICHHLYNSKDGTDLANLAKVIRLLSAAISTVELGAFCMSSSYISLCEQLLRSSTIDSLQIMYVDLNDTTAPFILSIASQAKKIEIEIILIWNSQHLSDPASFITQLYSMHSLSSVFLRHLSLPFFGLPHSFWENYL
ncbi:hypothetical protein PMAYCL1PPCAC_04945, partial [Pristionchus mayeri]